MGYRSDFYVTILPKDYITHTEIVEALSKLSNYEFTYLRDTEEYYIDDSKWYDREEHLIKVSKDFPNVNIVVEQHGEGRDDFKKLVAKNGAITRLKGTIVYYLE